MRMKLANLYPFEYVAGRNSGVIWAENKDKAISQIKEHYKGIEIKAWKFKHFDIKRFTMETRWKIMLPYYEKLIKPNSRIVDMGGAICIYRS